MATIPVVTQRTVLPSTQALPTASPNFISPATIFGRSLQQTGAQISQATDVLMQEMEKIQYEDDKREFRKLDAEFSSFLRAATYGDGTPENPGFVNTYGENAVNGFKTTQAAIDDKRKKLMEMASNQKVADMFSTAANERYDSTLNTFLNHTADQRKVANDAAIEARLSEAVNDAATNWSDPRVLEQSLLIAKGDVMDAAQAQGITDPTTIENMLNKANTEVISKTIEAAIIGAPKIAKALLASYGNQIDGFTKADLLDKIDRRIKTLVDDGFQAENRAYTLNKRQQDQNHANLIAGLASGTASSVDALDMLKRGAIDAGQYENAITFARTKDVGPGDDNAYLNLSVLIRTGELNGQDAYETILTHPTMDADQKDKLIALTNQNIESDPILTRSDVKTAREQITRVLSDPQGIMVKYDPAVKMRYNNALREFDDKIHTNPDQNPDTLAQEMINGYSSTPQTMSALRKPKYWPGAWGVRDLETLKIKMDQTLKATSTALSNKEISIDEFNEEVERLRAYTMMIGQMAEQQGMQ